MVLAVALVACALGAWSCWVWWRDRDAPAERFRRSLRRRVVLHTNEGYSLEGVLGGLYADGVELEAATFVRANDADTPLDGVQIVPWGSIAWAQELGDEPRRPGPANP